MITVQRALAIAMDAYPDTRLFEKPYEWRDMYAFRLVGKNMTDEEAKWCSGVIAVNKNSGKVSKINVFSDIDFLKNARQIQM